MYVVFVVFGLKISCSILKNSVHRIMKSHVFIAGMIFFLTVKLQAIDLLNG